MSLEKLTKSVEDIGAAWEAYKKTNDAKIAELEKKGAVDPLTIEKMGKIDKAIEDATEAKAKALEAIEGAKRVDELELTLKRAGGSLTGGDTILSKDEKAHKDALNAFLRKGDENGLKNLAPEYAKALSVGSDPDGGYTVTPQMSSQIIKTIYQSTPMRSVASVTTISTNELEFITDNDQASCGWVGETGARPETTTPQLGKISIKVNEMYAEPRSTQQLLDDSAFNIEQWLASKVAEVFARTENTAFITGDGVGKPRGILGYSIVADASWGWGSVGYIPTGGAGNWAASTPADALLNLIYALKEEYTAGASFLMSRARVGEVRQFKESTTNAYIWSPGLGSEPDTLLGYPVVRAPDMPAKGANSYSVGFGNWRSAYQIVDRQGIRVLRDPLTAKPYVKFYTTKRVGGGVVNFEAFKLLKFATS